VQKILDFIARNTIPVLFHDIFTVDGVTILNEEIIGCPVLEDGWRKMSNRDRLSRCMQSEH
jgi:hypothetical protein